MPIKAEGRLVDAEGRPIEGRKIVLQALRADGWTTIERIEDGRIDVRLSASGPAGREPVPMRLLDESTGTPLVISSSPRWTADKSTVVADFGTVQVLKDPITREGTTGGTEPVIGIPLDTLADDLVRGPWTGQVPSWPGASETVRGLRLELAENRELLSTARIDLSNALTQVDELTARLGTATKVVDVIAGLGTQLSLTNTELSQQTTPFRLADVRLDLRGRLGNDGSTIVMDGSGDGSGLSADLVVDTPSRTVPSRTVPDVAGMTASMAARVLRSVGFSMDRATQQLPPDQGVPGQSLAQQPPAGGEAEFGTAVLVVFGVRSENDA